ncbi:MAG TPA: hypothetical protein VL242_29965 [Sorangium sp.]|nr:hypothetical protein [Sorangium sp.]
MGELAVALPQPAVDLLVFADGSLWLVGPETVARTGSLPEPLTGVRLRPGTCASVLGIGAEWAREHAAAFAAQRAA